MDYDDDMEDVHNHLIFRCRLESTEDDLNYSTHSTDEPLVPSTNNSRIAKRRKSIEMMLDHYWERWRKECQHIPKQKHSTRISLNDVVLKYTMKSNVDTCREWGSQEPPSWKTWTCKGS